jgi:hypothetical protein
LGSCPRNSWANGYHRYAKRHHVRCMSSSAQRIYVDRDRRIRFSSIMAEFGPEPVSQCSKTSEMFLLSVFRALQSAYSNQYSKLLSWRRRFHMGSGRKLSWSIEACVADQKDCTSAVAFVNYRR